MQRLVKHTMMAGEALTAHCGSPRVPCRISLDSIAVAQRSPDNGPEVTLKVTSLCILHRVQRVQRPRTQDRVKQQATSSEGRERGWTHQGPLLGGCRKNAPGLDYGFIVRTGVHRRPPDMPESTQPVHPTPPPGHPGHPRRGRSQNTSASGSFHANRARNPLRPDAPSAPFCALCAAARRSCNSPARPGP